MNQLTLIGRIVTALPLLAFGIMHFANSAEMAPSIPSWLPGGVFWVYLTGLALLASAIGIALNKHSAYAYLGLGAMLLVFNLVLHIPHMVAEPAVLARLHSTTIEAGAVFKRLNSIVTFMNFLIIGMCIGLAGFSKKSEGV